MGETNVEVGKFSQKVKYNDKIERKIERKNEF